jgi:NAD-dependent deacetylase
VDDLHERGGAQAVTHMHGELLKTRCAVCSHVTAWTDDLAVQTPCPACGRAGALRPDVVWFGETPMYLDEIYEALAEADLFVSVGTSGSVYPASGFVAEARRAGIRTCEINLEPSENAWAFDEKVYGNATEVLPRWVEGMLAR